MSRPVIPTCAAVKCPHVARFRVRLLRHGGDPADVVLCGNHSRPFRLHPTCDAWTVLSVGALEYSGFTSDAPRQDPSRKEDHG